MDKILCNACGRWYDPQLIHHCQTESPPATPIIHLLIGAGSGFIIWQKTQSTLLAAGAGIAVAWFFQTKLGRTLALVAVLIAGVYLASAFYGA